MAPTTRRVRRRNPEDEHFDAQLQLAAKRQKILQEDQERRERLLGEAPWYAHMRFPEVDGRVEEPPHLKWRDFRDPSPQRFVQDAKPSGEDPDVHEQDPDIRGQVPDVDERDLDFRGQIPAVDEQDQSVIKFARTQEQLAELDKEVAALKVSYAGKVSLKKLMKVAPRKKPKKLRRKFWSYDPKKRDARDDILPLDEDEIEEDIAQMLFGDAVLAGSAPPTSSVESIAAIELFPVVKSTKAPAVPKLAATVTKRKPSQNGGKRNQAGAATKRSPAGGITKGSPAGGVKKRSPAGTLTKRMTRAAVNAVSSAIKSETKDILSPDRSNEQVKATSSSNRSNDEVKTTSSPDRSNGQVKGTFSPDRSDEQAEGTPSSSTSNKQPMKSTSNIPADALPADEPFKLNEPRPLGVRFNVSKTEEAWMWFTDRQKRKGPRYDNFDFGKPLHIRAVNRWRTQVRARNNEKLGMTQTLRDATTGKDTGRPGGPGVKLGNNRVKKSTRNSAKTVHDSDDESGDEEPDTSEAVQPAEKPIRKSARSARIIYDSDDDFDMEESKGVEVVRKPTTDRKTRSQGRVL